MAHILRRHILSFALAGLALVLAAGASQAQCMSGGSMRSQGSANRPMMSQQQRMQQMLQQQQMSLTSLFASQQQQLLLQRQLGQQQDLNLNSQQPLSQNLSLTALRLQRQQNSRLIALERKQRNTTQSFQSGRTAGFATAREEQQFLDAVQSAVDQTQALLDLLGQAGASADQTAWLNSLQQQSSTLTQISQRYSSDTVP